MPNLFSNIRSAAIDGRLHNPIYRKTQLKNLHDTLSQNAVEIQRAITKDTGHRVAEVKVECWLTMRCLGDAHAAIDPDKMLREEYAIASQKDGPDAQDPIGIVVIEPTAHTFFYSLMCAAVPAIAAGNCIIVQLEQSMLETPPLVLRLMSSALDNDIFHIATSKVQDTDLAHRHIRILQNGADEHLDNQLVSRPDTLVAAIVERDADLGAAAEALVLARYGLRGRSPYAPDIVLVNEWVKEDFLAAVIRSYVGLVAEGGGEAMSRREGMGQGFLREVSEEGYTDVVSAGENGVVLDVQNRKSFLLNRKLEGRCLAVHAVTSMDDAIDLTRSLGRVSAAYVFAKPAMAKYICQFIDSDASFVNSIPPDLLFGPIAPRGEPFNPAGGLYKASYFTLPKPQYITRSRTSKRIVDILTGSSAEQLRTLDDEAWASVPQMKRPEKAGGIGFFHQGIVTGGVVLLAAVVSCTGGACYLGLRHLWPLVWPKMHFL